MFVRQIMRGIVNAQPFSIKRIITGQVSNNQVTNYKQDTPGSDCLGTDRRKCLAMSP
jgi:hypothetical protein